MKYEGRELEPVVFDELEPGDIVMFHDRCSTSTIIRRVPIGEKIPEFMYTDPREVVCLVIQETKSGGFFSLHSGNARKYYLVSKAKPKDDFWWQDETQQGTLARALRETYKG